MWKVLNEKGIGFRDKEILISLEIGNKQFITSNKELILFGLFPLLITGKHLARGFLKSFPALSLQDEY